MAGDVEKIFREGLAEEEAGDLGAALKKYAEATRRDEKDPRYWIARGVASLQLGHHREAVRCLREGIKRKPHYGEADARSFLADALWASGKKSEAQREWQHISKMKPSYPGRDVPIERAKRMLAERCRTIR